MQTIYMLSEDDQKKDLGKSGQPFRMPYRKGPFRMKLARCALIRPCFGP